MKKLSKTSKTPPVDSKSKTSTAPLNNKSKKAKDKAKDKAKEPVKDTTTEEKAKDKVENKTEPTTEPVKVVREEIFPETLRVEKDTFLRTPLTYEDIKANFEKGVEMIVATYWSKEQIKEFEYAQSFKVNKNLLSKGFKNDLDLLDIVVVRETIQSFYAISRYSEGMFYFDEFVERLQNGMEYEIYVRI